MSRLLPRTAVLMAFIAGAPMTASAQALPESGFVPGDPFPTIAFPSLEDGRPMSVADFRGKRLILHIFASW